MYSDATHGTLNGTDGRETILTTILVIDHDQPRDHHLHRLTIDADDLRFVPALNLDEALRLLHTTEPDLILLSAQLRDPGWDVALQTLHEIVRDAPVALVTSYESTSEAVHAFRAGACDYLRKPLRPPELAASLLRARAVASTSKERDRLTHQLTRTTDRIRRQQEELNAVHVIGRLTTSLLDLDIILDRLTEIALHMTDAQESMLLLRDDKQGDLYLRAGKNLRPDLAGGFRMPLDCAAVGQAVATGEPVLITGEQAMANPACPSAALLHVPLRAPDAVIGLLTLSGHRDENIFSERDILLLSTLVDYASIAIRNARLFESIAESKSLMDGVFSSIASGVLTINGDGRISLINHAARQILCVPEASPGTSLEEICPSVESTLRGYIDTTRDQGKQVGPVEIDVSLPAQDVVRLRATLSPLKQRASRSDSVTIVLEDLTRQRKLESRFRLFQRYLSPTVIERLPDDPQELALGGVRREIACLFADLRGFVDFSLRHPPEQLMETLNRYLGVGAEAVLAQEGTLDKFVGDAVIAFFNAPLPQENYVLRAIKAAVRIRDRTRELHKHVSPEHQLTYGIGISVGEAIVGNIGTPQRLDYTAIGPSVNLANRLQANAKAGQILLSADVYERTRDHIIAHRLTFDGMPGREGPCHVYELLNLT